MSTRPAEPQQSFTLTDQSLSGKSWRLTILAESLRLDGPEGARFDVLRAKASEQVELIKGPGGRVILTVKAPKRLVFRLDAIQQAAIEQWLGPPTQQDLQVALKRRLSYGLAIGIFFMVTSLPMSGDPEQGIASVPFDALFFSLGLALVALRLVMKLWPRRVLFLVDALWFLVLGAKVVYNIAHGSSWLWGFVPLVCLISAYSGFGQYLRFKNVEAGRGAQPGV